MINNNVEERKRQLTTIVSMDYMKLHLGTLFLSNYTLPTFSSIVDVVCDKVKVISDDAYYPSVGCALNELLRRVIEREHDLLMFAKTDFLGKFGDRANEFDACVFPFDIKESAVIFFEKMFDSRFAPRTEDDIATLLEWCLFSVQFTESNVERTKDALRLLKKLKALCIESEYCVFSRSKVADAVNGIEPFSKNEGTQTVARRGVDYIEQAPHASMQRFKTNAVTNAWKRSVLVDYDTKKCSCYTYEVSGDCSCEQDDVFMSCHCND